ncbi:TRAP transporter permease [Salipiger abyssi]|uniref:TRAP transporter permease n=1 Tax=Salipiger abyssi TaxID=1250539 RepID=UPI0040582B5C
MGSADHTATMTPRASWATLLALTLNILLVALPVAYAANLQRRFGLSVYDAQLLVSVLSIALARGFLQIHIDGERGPLLRGLMLLCAALTLGVGFYVGLFYPEISMEAPFMPPWLIAISAVLFGALMLSLRRSVGMGILVVVLLFLGYGLFGHLLPGELRSRPTSPAELVTYLAIDANGMLGTALKVGVVIVIPYLLFGQLLARCGAADFFNDIALAGMGRFRGGPAKVAVAASGLFGSISGSAVGNVVGTGVVTIPMMKRSGFSGTYAGAVEAVASTGGQLVPPVMGAAAFIMADFIGVDYAVVMLAALPSAALYYLAVFINVDLNAGKAGVAAIPRAELPSALATLRQGWHFLLPFAVLFYGLFELNMRPERAAIWAIGTLFAVSLIFGYKGRRLPLRESWSVLGEAGIAASGLVIVCAAAGLIIGVLNVSGLAFNLTLHIINASGQSVFLLALITALISIVLGMGMPTVGVYVLLATLVAPALVEVGVPVVAAHLFVLYFGLLSMVTPPVALAAFAGANIAGASAWDTSIAAMKLAWPAYIVPFLFIFAPSLILEGDWLHILWALFSAILGILMVTAAMVGFLRQTLPTALRLLLGVGGVLALLPAGLFPSAIWTDAAGVTIFAVVYGSGLRKASASRTKVTQLGVLKSEDSG